MDQKKIGEFLCACRKKKKITQTELAEKLGVTNKSISNWENARCMPDLSLFKPLCEILDISVNDLLSGEKIDKEEYVKKSEENIFSAIDYSRKILMSHEKKINSMILFIGLIIIIGAFAIAPTDSSWGSIYSIVGVSVFTYGSFRFFRTKRLHKRVFLSAIIFSIFLAFLIILDFISVLNYHVAPRFSLLKSTGSDMIVYEAPFYKVYRINYDTKNEYYIVDAKKEYTEDTIPKSPFKRDRSGFASIVRYKNRYIGNNSNTGNLINTLPLAEHGYTFEIDATHEGMIINYHLTSWYQDTDDYFKKALIYNTISMFTMIENLKYITFNTSNISYKAEKSKVESIYPDFEKIEDEKTFDKYLENKMYDEQFLDKMFNKLFLE